MPQIAEMTGAQITEVARRRARFRYATDRITKIADGEPRFTDAELAELAGLLLARMSTAGTAA